MALPKVIRLAVVLLVICCALDKSGFRHSVSDFFEELMAVKSPSIHVREKRETFTNFTDYEFQVVLSVSELETLRTILSNLSFPILINSTSEISNIDATTVCSQNISGNHLYCVCEENFAWSYNSCITYGVCDAIVGDTCGCINGLPADGQFCQVNSSQTVTAQTPSSTAAPELVDFDVILDLHIPLSGVPDDILELIRRILGNETFPVTVSQSLEVTEMLLTTACSPNSTDRLLCDCEDGFAWPCDKCNGSNSCSDVSSQTCTCIYGLPSDNEYCQPITNNSFCPTPPPVLTTMTTAMPSTTTPSPPTNYETSTILTTTSSPPPHETSIVMSTTSSPPTLHESKDIGIVLDLHIPFSNVPPDMLDLIRTALENETFPVRVSQFVEVIELNLTTACSPNATDGLRCECEDGYAWPCDMCNGNNSCKDVSSQTCTCKYGLLSNEEFCQPITDIDLCPTASPAIPNTSTVMPTMETGYPNTSTPSANYVELYVLHELFIPVASVPPNIVDLFRAALKNESFPVTLTASLKVIELNITTVVCKAQDGFSAGSVGFEAVASCEKGKVGTITAVCKADGTYGDVQDNCVLEVIHNLLSESEALDVVTLPAFLEELKGATINNSQTITDSPATISAMVQIFANIGRRAGSLKITISEESTKNILESAGILTSDAAKGSWDKLNSDSKNESSENKNFSSSFLSAFEGITASVVNKPLNINTTHILFTKTNFTNNFKVDFNSSVEIDIPEAGGSRQSIAVMLFASMDNVLPARESVNTSSSFINGKVVLIKPESDINNILIAFDVLNETLGKPKCVFWDFDLLEGLGGWSDEGCAFVLNENGTVRCNCNHTTSFSILFSPDSPQDVVLDFITYIGIGISMGSLIVCLIIEGIAWRKIRSNSTSYLRHVSIVNIAVSLLIADIWFIIGAAISNTNSAPACTAATFFIHFFYLALFFWMLASALLLLYRTLSVFEGGLSKLTMLIIGFALGYGAPLIIAVITIASTAPSNEYIRENVVCWLNWDQSKALLAFVVPALMIVVINLVILVVVLYKILRRRGGGNASQAEEKNVLYVIARSLAVLTPLFGLTWGLGVGVMLSPKNRGMHITFALFNSVQGFFILLFGTLLDTTVRKAMTKSQTSSSRSKTTSTSIGNSLLNMLKKTRRPTNDYRSASNGSNT
ncbi:adhesion G protein-coupled receptor F5-like [Gambusia affinis]|uniref:adhesion G protein-coupled receptor F5-like n=1 Tax=Gambusia affinis TaxID=33528 RepID=UPI001CDC0A32|nr:adhesion G protein-coupled receptor F5-like [Gambusia affinis]